MSNKTKHEEPNNPNEGGSVAWGCVAVIFFAIMCFFAINYLREEVKKVQAEETTDTITWVDEWAEDRIDLNDYLRDERDNITDWNYTDYDETMERYLEEVGIYFDKEKGYWVKR